MSDRGKFKSPYRRRTGPAKRTELDSPSLDTSFFTKTEYHAPAATSDVFLHNTGGVGFGEVRILNAAGECVRIWSVDELLARPRLPWNPAEPDHDPNRSNKRSTKRKYGSPLTD